MSSAGDKIIAGLEDAVAFAKGEAFAKVRIAQSRGPAIEFEGKLIAHDEFDVRRDNSRMRLEVWETQGGALIAVTRGEAMQGGEAREIVDATVVEPGITIASLRNPKPGSPEAEEETQAMRFAVMQAFDWSDRSRSMVRKQLKWKLVQRVE